MRVHHLAQLPMRDCVGGTVPVDYYAGFRVGLFVHFGTVDSLTTRRVLIKMKSP